MVTHLLTAKCILVLGTQSHKYVCIEAVVQVIFELLLTFSRSVVSCILWFVNYYLTTVTCLFVVFFTVDSGGTISIAYSNESG